MAHKANETNPAGTVEATKALTDPEALALGQLIAATEAAINESNGQIWEAARALGEAGYAAIVINGVKRNVKHTRSGWRVMPANRVARKPKERKTLTIG